MSSVKENRPPFKFSEKNVQSLSNTALNTKSEILLKIKERLETVEYEFDNAKGEIKDQNSKIEILKEQLKIKENECKTYDIRFQELNGKYN